MPAENQEQPRGQLDQEGIPDCSQQIPAVVVSVQKLNEGKAPDSAVNDRRRGESTPGQNQQKEQSGTLVNVGIVK